MRHTEEIETKIVIAEKRVEANSYKLSSLDSRKTGE